ncbi:13524_t:CDS:2 [Funneliformis geosporum]|nr:13524_t:CDS:2 [Funneliformis geosporum]
MITIEEIREDKKKAEERLVKAEKKLDVFSISSRGERSIEDVSSQLIIDMIKKRPKPTLPSVNELADFLDQPIPETLKLPLSQDQLQPFISFEYPSSCTENDLNIIFRISEEQTSFFLLSQLVGQIITKNAPPSNSTEDTYHLFWDLNIRSPLELLIPNGISVRNTSQHISTANKRPDYGFIVGQICTFRGEEKPEMSNEDPKAELRDKLIWAYGAAPYVMGYYAEGTNVTFVAICRPSSDSNKPQVINIASSNLRYRNERIINLRRMFNLALLLDSLKEIIGWRGAPELLPIEKHVDNIHIEKLKVIYEKLLHKNVPNVDHIVAVSLPDEIKPYLYLEPRGMCVYPKTEKEVIEAVLCVLEALMSMHGSNPIFHRDIRWSNVIQKANGNKPSKWFLIDFDDAVSPPTFAAMHLAKETHAPEVFHDDHGGEVDVWGVGHLIDYAARLSVGLSAGIMDVGKWMQSETTSRPTAWQAYERIKILANFIE